MWRPKLCQWRWLQPVCRWHRMEVHWNNLRQALRRRSDLDLNQAWSGYRAPSHRLSRPMRWHFRLLNNLHSTDWLHLCLWSDYICTELHSKLRKQQSWQWGDLWWRQPRRRWWLFSHLLGRDWVPMPPSRPLPGKLRKRVLWWSWFEDRNINRNKQWGVWRWEYG
jgi:hypothetical protein